ncbi:DNA sulfur modification protein DndD [Massilia sp. CFBP9012]|uniref:DNA sulfur modification protein DndD n=1 Tax=Massilia sp. CFBP9012 TaxID=3096531 RepID=UPI002A6B050E|nr:DNA sulfur modification protein DndD [Massilia sp. CFBP9012]MDY0977706.1 DNA sulfur modification protein DndD [Massilia sp. CFBP9012]
MLFQEFVLHNFGIYKGRHAVDLNPEPGRPIVLFGALNGSGKTTFLDGLQLVLYGKHARCAGRGNMAYPDFLRSTINRFVAPQEGAGLELEFIHYHEKWHTIRVIRTWNGRQETTRERLEVYRNGVLDAVLSERWNEFVEDFIPSQISELFFFDGEKIEALAEEQSAAAIIRTGIHALLGLDVVDRLAADIKIVQRRRRVEELDLEAQAQVRTKLDAMQALSEHADTLTAKIQEQEEKVKGRRRVLQVLEEEYRQQGGELAEQTGAIEAQLKVAQEQKDLHDAYLRDKLAAGHVPLLLVQDLLRSARTQLTAESDAQLASAMLSEISERDTRVLVMLTHSEVSETVRQAVAEQLERDRQARATAAQAPAYLHMRADALQPYTATQFDALHFDLNEALERQQIVTERVNDLERTKAALPNPELLAPLRERLTEQRRQYEQAVGAVGLLKQQYEDCVKAKEQTERERQNLMLELADQDLKDKTKKRVLRHAERVEETLKRYRDAVLQRNVKRLSDLILESFQKITRKQHMFERIEISPETYRLSLFDHGGNQIPSHQLSAGERQLLAVSILWGLSRASGRLLPAIIDTPLGRLDGHHRNKLVKNYFPKASNQVILLSTDQEIDEDLYGKIKRVTTREYLIEYNQQHQSSEIQPGYFTFDEAFS